ncbi:LysM peptidoglycan-binding domain-containing protein [Kingella kingae]|uniref:LysM peptidoglycan-binding domain-containing protein n=1 Tax=Kingella kingae TaxID=504 RepID=UPI002551BCBE|nr:LysM peptidoglycan-binding domain-containing protein [Kingella kingae]MDK4544878.1 LysM peptidoglycan-binding domain-containing protein [Kingella kingae]MDK4566764.1 LysM peptidoglycan-binding domain-containing protein [Kingella kingae]MDK4628643.1 LysM peptidoglycan-binding domain-containing protein [Kingella kingae]MDK4636576.1 LysM peptidoglycan-binding domain-containing protein [Kingella kingae]MDK4638600.1 LysM peptidoglycan-binding domain-containing protein [Kingella kingae]
MKSIKTIAIAVSSLFVLSTSAHGKTVQPEQTGIAMMRLHNTSFSLPLSRLSSNDLWLNLRQDFRMDEVNVGLVRSHESRFLANRDYFNRTLVRSTPYMYHIVSEVQKRGMPAEIALLPFIESAYVTKARSHVGASGLWQFMPATGRHYGLEQTPLYDGRHDVFAATDAALNYLQYLYGLFGDWSLALAAYNWGEGNMSRAIRRAQSAGLAPTYENLNMPAETRNYVPKLLAVRNLINNPQAFGLNLPTIKHEPYFKAVTVNTPLDILAAAHLANISESEFLALNPAFKTPVFMPKGNRRMLLPVSAARTFESNYKESDPKTLLSWDVFTPIERISLADLASRTGSTASELKRLNGLTSNYVNAGRTVLINKNTMTGIASVNDFARADFDAVPDTYVEQKPVLTVAPTLASPAKQPALLTVNLAAPRQPSDKPTAPIIATPALAENKPVTAPSVVFVTPPVVSNTVVAEPNVQAASAVANNDETDELMQVVARAQQEQKQQNTAIENQAAAAVRASVAEFEAAEARERAAEARRQQQLAADKVKAATVAANKPATAQKQPARPVVSTTATHKVARGESVYSIAKRYNMEVADLRTANGIKGNSIRIGQELKIQTARKTTATVQAASRNKPATTANNKPADNKRQTVPVTHTVRRGESIQSIAARYKVSPADLKRWNNGSNNIKAGQVLKLRPS